MYVYQNLYFGLKGGRVIQRIKQTQAASYQYNTCSNEWHQLTELLHHRYASGGVEGWSRGVEETKEWRTGRQDVV